MYMIYVYIYIYIVFATGKYNTAADLFFESRHYRQICQQPTL